MESFPSRHAASMRHRAYRDAGLTLQTTAHRPLLVLLVPSATTNPRLASSIRLGRCVLGFIPSRLCISSSVSPPGVV